MAKAVSGAVNAVSHAAGDVAGAVGHAAGDVAGAVGHAADRVGGAVSHAASNVAGGVTHAAQATVGAIQSGANAVADGIAGLSQIGIAAARSTFESFPALTQLVGAPFLGPMLSPAAAIASPLIYAQQAIEQGVGQGLQELLGCMQNPAMNLANEIRSLMQSLDNIGEMLLDGGQADLGAMMGVLEGFVGNEIRMLGDLRA